MTTAEFNYHIQRVNDDPKSLDLIYKYTICVSKGYILKRFGVKYYDSTVPHDVFTKCMIESTPREYITCPKAWLCRITENFMISKLKRKDNNTLELREDYSYVPEYGEAFDFNDPDFKAAWDSLDDETRLILHLAFAQSFKLNEIAYALDKKDTYVRTKKSRAVKILRKSVGKGRCKFKHKKKNFDLEV